MRETEGVVFIVDDDASMRCSLERLMRSCGIRAESFASAREFLQHSLPEEPACLVLDIQMPEFSGLDLQDALTSVQSDLPIIFITAYDTVPLSVRRLNGCAVACLAKPFDDQELLDAIQKALERSSLLMRQAAESSSTQQRTDSSKPREHEVLALIVRGMLNGQSADRPGNDEKTVKARTRIVKKTQTHSLAELLRRAGKGE